MKGMTFNTFIEDENNQAAVDLCRRVAALDKSVKSPVVLLADRGAGKTHLLWAIVNHYREHQTRVGVALISATDFPRKVRRLVEDPTPLEKNRSAVLLVDELELFREDAGDLEAVVRVFLDRGHTVVLASQVHPSALSALSGRFRALLSGGTIIGFQAARGGREVAALPESVLNQIASLKQTIENLSAERDSLAARLEAMASDTDTVLRGRNAGESSSMGGDAVERAIQERDAARQALEASEAELLEIRHQLETIEARFDAARLSAASLEAVLDGTGAYQRTARARTRDALSTLATALLDASDAPEATRNRAALLLAQFDAPDEADALTGVRDRAMTAAGEIATLLDRAAEAGCPGDILESLRRHIETLIRLEHLLEDRADAGRAGSPAGREVVGTISEQIRLAFGDPSEDGEVDMTWATPVREDDEPGAAPAGPST